MKVDIRVVAGSLMLLVAQTMAAAPLPDNGACLQWRWIGVANNENAACAQMAPTGWQGARLFTAAEATTPPALTRFCRFETHVANPSTTTIEALVGPRLRKIERDCVVVSPQADPTLLAAVQWPALAAELAEQSGAAALAATTVLGSAPVRLAVLDGNPTNAIDPETDSGTSPHGNALITMAEQLLCPGTGGCAAQITSRLALSFLRVNPSQRAAADIDMVNGGYLASVGDLAAATYKEVAAWRGGAAGSRLILNISLGWDGAFGGDEARVVDMPAAAQAMHAVLLDASCRGVLVFAAAGNRSGDPVIETGPLLPAGWERRAAPDFAACASALGATAVLDPLNFSGSNYRPLVLAVSAIEADGSDLDNARLGARARLVAYGDHAAVESLARSAGEPTATLSGSSVATLLASANAALAWSHDSTMNPHQLVDFLYAAANGSSSALTRSADICLHDASGACVTGVDYSAHRLSLCLTRWAVGDPGLTQEDCAWDADNPLMAVDYSAFDAAASRIDLTRYTRTSIDSSCGAIVLRTNPDRPTPAQPCPHLTLPSLGERPWVLPQPGSDLCPQCEDGGLAAKSARAKVAAPRLLRMQITPRLTEQITAVTLVAGTQFYALALDRPLSSGDRLVLEGLETIAGDREHVTVAFAVNASHTAISTVLLAQ
jgi:hypothetical protein